MGKKQESNTGFVIQGSILAMASIIARIIGLVYRVPVTRIIGDYGNGLYGYAFEVYNMVLIISSYSLPAAISKLVSARANRGQHKDAYKIFKAGLIFAIVVGLLASSLTFLMADFISVVIMKDGMIALCLRVLAPTIFVVAVMGVLRGYCQGLGTMIPTAISQILEAIVNAIVSIAAAAYLFAYGTKVGKVLQEEKYAAAYGAAGSTLGTLTSGIIGLLFLIAVFLMYKTVLDKKLKRDVRSREESYVQVYRVLFATIVPIIMSTAVYNCSVFIDQTIFSNIMSERGYTDYTELFGVFTGKYRLLVNVPVSIASAMAASTMPSITAAVARADVKMVRQKINISHRFIMVISIPCFVGLTVLGSPILQLLFDDNRKLPANLLMVGSIAVVFYSLSTLSNGILQGLNKMSIPVINAFIALVIHIGVVYFLTAFTDMKIYSVVIGNVVFSGIMCILNNIAVKKATGYRHEVKKTFFIPTLASLVMGAASYGIYAGLMAVTKNNTVSILIALIVAVIVYGVMMLVLKGFTEEELLALPKGRMLLGIARKLHLM